MKKIIALILEITLICSLVGMVHISASAEEANNSFSLEFQLTADNNSSVYLANHGDIITVTFTIRRTDLDDKYTTNGFQNYIHYDHSFFEFVENSIVCNDTGMGSAKKQNSITYGEIVQCQNMGKEYASEFVFCSFKLKVIGTGGSGMVYNDEIYAFDKSHQSVTVTKQNLQIIINTGCTHKNKTKIDAEAPGCYLKGWYAYYDCDDCDAFFGEDAETLIAGIPYIDQTHSFSDELSYDESGHWYECTLCSQRKRYSKHYGDEANCSTKAECVVCGSEYGSTDMHNHTGKAFVKNKKVTWFWSNGYSGDVHCSTCQSMIEMGAEISMFTVSAWPLWSIIVTIFLFPIVVVGWLIILIF